MVELCDTASPSIQRALYGSVRCICVAMAIQIQWFCIGEKYVDVTLLISASEGTQRKRILKDRKLPINVFERIKDQQLPDKDKREKADHIISTDQSIEETMQEVKIMVDKFKKIKPKAWVEHYSK